MQTTRARIVELLRDGHTATIDDMTRELSLAPATVRRHLDVLLRDGVVEMRAQRRHLGRPHFVFTLSAAGRDSLPAHQVRLSQAVLAEVLALTRAETRGRTGREIASLIFDRLAERLLGACAERVNAAEVGGRVRQVTQALNDAGLEFEAAPAERGYVLRGAGCPCMRLLSGETVCRHEEKLLSRVLGAPVQRLHSEAGTSAFRVGATAV